MHGKMRKNCEELISLRSCCQPYLGDIEYNILKGDMFCTKECLPSGLGVKLAGIYPPQDYLSTWNSTDRINLETFLENSNPADFCVSTAGLVQVSVCQFRFVGIAAVGAGVIVTLILALLWKLCSKCCCKKKVKNYYSSGHNCECNNNNNNRV